MDAVVRTYDPKKVIITFGALTLSGYADGTFISIERSGAMFEKKKGADGSVDRINKNSFDFSVTLTIKQTSPANLALQAIATADQMSNKGVLPLIVKDLAGNSLFTAPQAWISEDPKDEFSDSLSNREWKFETGPAVKVSGGN